MPRTRSARAAAPRRGAHRSKPLEALLSLLDTHGYKPGFPESAVSEESIVSRVASGAVPPAYLVALAERCASDGLELLGRATAMAGFRSASRAENRQAARPAPARADAAAIGLEEAFARVFASLGEERSGQLEMARAVRKVLVGGGVAILEAGTGTGKSLGYLVPSVLHSLETEERIVVSTHTRNLQDQLFRKEMNVLEAALSIDAGAARLLGRENYLCTARLIARASGLTARTTAPALAFALHAALAEGGTLESLGALPGGADSRALAAPVRCPMNACAFAARCPLVRARADAREARILFVNHALLFTDYCQGNSILGPYARVIFDEAHHLERCVMENLSVKLSRDEVKRILEPLWPVDAGDHTWKLLSHELESSALPAGRTSLRREFERSARQLEKAYAALFTAIAAALNADTTARSTRTRYIDGTETFAEVRGHFDRIYIFINKLNELLKPMLDIRLSRDLESRQQEIACANERLATLAESLRFLSMGGGEDSVFWLDWGGEGDLREICGSPLAVDRSFADYLEGFLGSAVFTSATLSENGSFALLKERLGLRHLPFKPLELIIPSPFPFDENCLVLVVSGLGDPNHEGFALPVARLVAQLAAGIGRRTMVLFTSYRLCRSVAAAIAGTGIERPILVQGTGESREALSGRLRRHEGGVLLGVASFWEGVDFPGEELEVLVIPKLPFPVPSEPIVEARSQRYASLGEDPFEKLYLPEAVLRLRQGSGRLMRRMNDRGVIIILDSRLEVRPYGKAILAALPSRNIEHVGIEECVARAAQWFAGTRVPL